VKAGRVGARAWVASWAARGAGQRVSAGQPPSGPRQARQAGKGGGRRPGWLELGQKVNFFFCPNQIFIQFYFLHFHF